MALNPQDKSQGSKIGIPAEGTIPARLVRIVELGVHDTKFKEKDQVQFWFSLPTRIITDEGDYQGKQHMVRTQALTKSSNEKATLMDYVNVLAPSATGLGELLNKPCYLRIIHNKVDSGKGIVTYANIAGVMPVPEGMNVGEADTVPFYFDFDAPDAEIWTKYLWDNIREKIMSAKNYTGSAVEKMVLGLEAK